MGRRKGSGAGYVGPITTRVHPSTFKALEEWRAVHELSQGEAVRRLLDAALQQEGLLKEIAPDAQEREEALMRARADLHRAVNLAWEMVTK
jgi:hypothetical protein